MIFEEIKEDLYEFREAHRKSNWDRQIYLKVKEEQDLKSSEYVHTKSDKVNWEVNWIYSYLFTKHLIISREFNKHLLKKSTEYKEWKRVFLRTNTEWTAVNDVNLKMTAESKWPCSSRAPSSLTSTLFKCSLASSSTGSDVSLKGAYCCSAPCFPSWTYLTATPFSSSSHATLARRE